MKNQEIDISFKVETADIEQEIIDKVSREIIENIEDRLSREIVNEAKAMLLRKMDSMVDALIVAAIEKIALSDVSWGHKTLSDAIEYQVSKFFHRRNSGMQDSQAQEILEKLVSKNMGFNFTEVIQKSIDEQKKAFTDKVDEAMKKTASQFLK